MYIFLHILLPNSYTIDIQRKNFSDFICLLNLKLETENSLTQEQWCAEPKAHSLMLIC